MATPSGQIGLSEVNEELGVSPTSTAINMGSTPVRALAGIPSGAIAMSDLQSKTNEYTFTWLVVAGGGGGGENQGSGAGAGGFISGSIENAPGISYSASIGGGGSPNTGFTSRGNSGSNSVFHNTTSTGGGYGAAETPGIGGPGGSGGGGRQGQSAGSGIGGQGNPGSVGQGAGGGGAGGGAGQGGLGVNGGNGSTFPGDNIAYAGGGGGWRPGSGSGGNGGGGNGGAPGGQAAQSGQTNRGGGGGGLGHWDQNAGSGGSGRVVIAYPGTTQKGSGGTQSIVSSNRVHSFNSPGTYTS